MATTMPADISEVSNLSTTPWVKFRLPLNTKVHVRGCTNAAFQQRATIFYGGEPKVLKGVGEDDNPTEPNGFSFTTGPTSPDNSGDWPVTVLLENYQNGQWVPTDAYGSQVVLGHRGVAIAVGEDGGDRDWNDVLIELGWWIPA